MNKEQARQKGQDFQTEVSKNNFSYGEILEKQNELYKIAKKYGLIREFKENCIL